MSAQLARQHPVKVQLGEVTPDCTKVELAMRGKPLPPKLRSALRRDLEQGLQDDAVLHDGAVRQSGRNGRNVLLTAAFDRDSEQQVDLVQESADDLARKREVEDQATLSRVGGLVDRFFKRLRREARRVNRQIRKAVHRKARGRRNRVKRDIKAGRLEHQVRPVKRKSLYPSQRARFASRGRSSRS